MHKILHSKKNPTVKQANNKRTAERYINRLLRTFSNNTCYSIKLSFQGIVTEPVVEDKYGNYITDTLVGIRSTKKQKIGKKKLFEQKWQSYRAY